MNLLNVELRRPTEAQKAAANRTDEERRRQRRFKIELSDESDVESRAVSPLAFGDLINERVARELDDLGDGLCIGRCCRYIVLGAILADLFLIVAMMGITLSGDFSLFAGLAAANGSNTTAIQPHVPRFQLDHLMAKTTTTSAEEPDWAVLRSINRTIHCLKRLQVKKVNVSLVESCIQTVRVTANVAGLSGFESFYTISAISLTGSIYAFLIIVALLWSLCGLLCGVRGRLFTMIVYAILLDMLTMTIFLSIIFPAMVWSPMSTQERSLYELAYMVLQFWNILLALFVFKVVLARRRSRRRIGAIRLRQRRPQIVLQTSTPIVTFRHGQRMRCPGGHGNAGAGGGDYPKYPKDAIDHSVESSERKNLTEADLNAGRF